MGNNDASAYGSFTNGCVVCGCYDDKDYMIDYDYD